MCCQFDITQKIQPVLKLKKLSYYNPWKHFAEIFEVFLIQISSLPLKIESTGCERRGLLVRKGGKRGCILFDESDALIVELGYTRFILAINGPESSGILIGELHNVCNDLGPIRTNVCPKRFYG